MSCPPVGTLYAYDPASLMFRYVTIVCASLIGCGSSLPLAPTSPHTADEFVAVPFPPPAVRAGVVPPRLHPDSVWVDGEWQWVQARWEWQRGAWLQPPEGSTLARSETHRAGAQVRHAASVFHLAGGGSLAPADLRERKRRFPPDAACAAPVPASFEQRAAWPAANAP